VIFFIKDHPRIVNGGYQTIVGIGLVHRAFPVLKSRGGLLRQKKSGVQQILKAQGNLGFFFLTSCFLECF